MQKVIVNRWGLILIILLAFLLTDGAIHNLYSQQQSKPPVNTQQKPPATKVSKPSPPVIQPAKTITVNPSFPGGNDSLKLYLFSNIEQPDSLMARDISGTIYFSFFVEADGKIDKIKIENGPPSSGWDTAAIRCIRTMPKWIPGKVNGKATGMRYFLPVFVPPGHELFNMPDSTSNK